MPIIDVYLLFKCFLENKNSIHLYNIWVCYLFSDHLYVKMFGYETVE